VLNKNKIPNLIHNQWSLFYGNGYRNNSVCVWICDHCNSQLTDSKYGWFWPLSRTDEGEE